MNIWEKITKYIGKTGILLKTRLREHRKDIDNKNNEKTQKEREKE